MVPLFSYNHSGLAIHLSIYHRLRGSYVWAAYEGKSSNLHTDTILISLTLGNKGLFCALGSQLINSPLSEPEQANWCSPATQLWMTPALCSSQPQNPKSPPLLTYSCPSGKLVSVHKGEAVMVQREVREPRRVFVLRGTLSLFDTGGLRPWQAGNEGSAGKICYFRVSILVRKNKAKKTPTLSQEAQLLAELSRPTSRSRR